MAGQGEMLSAPITRHVVSATFSELPQSTRQAAAQALLDGLGVMLGGSGSAEARPFVELARRGGGSDARIFGTGFRASAPSAALANGAMAHVLDFEDAFDAAPTHPNASLLPAALAIAESHPVTGEELLTAIAVGCDLVCRLGLALRRPMEEGGWYPPPILGAFGATAACAILLKLDQRQVLDAFSLMLGQISCPGEIKNSRDTVIRAVREAFPAQAAVTSSLLAQQGVRGFEEPFEGQAGFFALFADGRYDPTDILDRLGQYFWIERLTYKRWPCCRGTHAFIEAVHLIRQRRTFDWRDVERIEISIGEVQRMLAYPEDRKTRPATPIDAKFSAQFTTAVALVRGDVTLESFDPAALVDPDILDAASRITLVDRPDWGRDKGATGEAALYFADGTCERQFVPVAFGHPDHPLDAATLRAKFVDCAGRAAEPLGKAQAEAMADRVLTIHDAPDAISWIFGTD